jgi:hypothetical protein
MRKFRWFWFLLAVLIVTPLAHADGTTMVEFTGVNGANNGYYYVSPYLGVVNYGTSQAQPVLLFCDDINNEVGFGQVWTANITSLASGNFSDTRYGNGSVNPNLGSENPEVLYDEAAWLTTQFASHPSDYVSLQYALWDLMTPGAEPLTYRGTDGIQVSKWLDLAGANYNSINTANFEILTNSQPVTYRGQVQEFIVETPEPASTTLLVSGLLFAGFFLVRKRQQAEA